MRHTGAPVGETSLTGGDPDGIRTGKLALSGYLARSYAAPAPSTSSITRPVTPSPSRWL
jgi:hypothetical protein